MRVHTRRLFTNNATCRVEVSDSSKYGASGNRSIEQYRKIARRELRKQGFLRVKPEHMRAMRGRDWSFGQVDFTIAAKYLLPGEAVTFKVTIK
jgi:hypothetical protein